MAYLMIAKGQYENPALAGFYNVGPDDKDCISTGELVDSFCQSWGEGMTWENRSVGGPHEANFLKLDCSRMKKVFGWKPRWGVYEAVEKTVEWTKTWLAGEDVVLCMNHQIDEFCGDHKRRSSDVV